MNRFKKEIMELGFGLYRENQCSRICALARTFGVSPEEFNGRVSDIHDAEQSLLHSAMKKAAADCLGIEVRQLSKLVRAGHVAVEHFQWDNVNPWDTDSEPTCGPWFTAPDWMGFVIPVFGEDNSRVYADFPSFQYRMSVNCHEDSWWWNSEIIRGVEDILDVIEDEEISDEVADLVLIAFSDCIGEDYTHPSMLEVCYHILRRAWSWAA